MDDHGNAVKLHSGKIGSNPHYDKSVAAGKVITDPSTFDFDEELKKPGTVLKYHEILKFGDHVIEESYKNCDKFRIINSEAKLQAEDGGWDYKPIKIRCYECLEVHTIGHFIVFPGWDEIIYFDIETEEVVIESIR